MKNKILFMLSFTALILTLTIGTVFAVPVVEIEVADSGISTTGFMEEEEVKNIDSPVEISVSAENYSSVKYHIADTYFTEAEAAEYITAEEWIEYTEPVSCNGYGFKQFIVVVEDENMEYFYSLNLNLTSKYGQLVYKNDIPHFVSEDGITSVFIEDNDMVWLQEESDGMALQLGLDNTDGVFERDSRFFVNWMSKDSSRFNEINNMIDDDIKSQLDTGKMLVFDLGVAKSDDSEYAELDKGVSLYIELPEGWDRDKIEIAYISSGKDEQFMEQIESMNGKTFAVLKLNHFSPYLVYEKQPVKETQPMEEKATSDSTSPKTMDMGAVGLIKNVCFAL